MSRSKLSMISSQYYDLTEDEMQAIIKSAKAGDQDAMEELLNIFANFLNKYTTMLYRNKYSLGDYDIRRFVGLFIKDPQVRRALSKKKKTKEALRDIHDTMRGIHYMVLRYGDEDDVRQTVQMTFMQCVERYERRGKIPFSGYLYSYYFFLLKKNVEILLIDQIGRKTYALITEEDMSEDGEDGERLSGFTAPPTEAFEDMLYAEKIDENWVLGTTAYPPFDVLTVQERQLLKWRFVNGEKTSSIANKTTEHPNTVREKIKKIKAKLEEAILQDLKEEVY